MVAEPNYVDLFERDETRLRRKPGTIDTRVGVVRRFVEHFGSLDQVSPKRLRQWVLGRGNSNTQYVYLEALRAFYRFALKCDFVDDDPTVDIELGPRQRSEVVTPSDEEVDKAIGEATNEKVRCWVALAAYQGLRSRDIAALTAEAIDFDSLPPRLVLTDSERRSRTAALHPVVLASLTALPLPTTGRLFEHEPSYVSQELRKNAERLDVHTRQGELVHWYAAHALDEGPNFGMRLPAIPPSETEALSPIEQRLIPVLEQCSPSAALSYRQVIRDLENDDRLSFRGTANDLRGVVWDVLEQLAPEEAVVAAPGFTFEKGMTKATQRQKTLFVLRSRSGRARETAVLAFDAADEKVASLSRSLYGRTSNSSHVGSGRGEVRLQKMYADALLAEVFEVHRA